MAGTFVDPAVSRAKFEREIANYRKLDTEYRRRGWFLVRAEFPVVEVLFTTPQLRPNAAVFIARLDFTNYDSVAPSLQLANPVTNAPFRFNEINAVIQFLQHRPVGDVPGGHLIQSAPLMQAHEPTAVPFFCLPGVGEYHAQPAHSGDSWWLHRLTGEGTLVNILDKLHSTSIGELGGFQIGMQIVGFTRKQPAL